MISSRDTMALRLSRMVRFPTVSHEDDEQMDFSAFSAFHAYLKETYPRVHKTMTLEIIGKAGLLYHWASPKKKKKAPVMLTTHQDVVPALEPGWTYPPYSGMIANGFVWGRGSSDSKSLLLAHMEALEALIEDGFVPDYDIYLGYGYNEEVGGGKNGSSAKMICQTLEQRGVRLGILIDEGGFITPGEKIGAKGLVANIYIAEKGTGNYLIYKEGKAGHTAAPGKTNLVADLAKAITKLSEKTMECRITEPLKQELALLAPYAGENRELLLHAEEHPEEINQLYENDPIMQAKMRTTIAMTMLEGSPGPQATPSRVSVRLNCRLLQGDTQESIREQLQQIVGDDMKVALLGGREASPVSNLNCREFSVLKKAICQEHPDAEVFPTLLCAGTDARFYYPICDCVCRFTGFLDLLCEGKSGHCVDERFAIATLDSSAKLFYRFLKMNCEDTQE